MLRRIITLFFLGSTIFASEPPIRLGFCSQITKKGLALTGVGKGSPAEKAGLQSGDLITHVQGMKISGSNIGEQVAAYMDSINATRGMKGSWIFAVNRNGRFVRMEVTGEPYEDPLSLTPYRSNRAPEIPESQRISLSWIKQILPSLRNLKEFSEYVYINEANFDGEYLKGLSSFVLSGVIKKKPIIYLFMVSPKSLLKAELFKELNSLEEPRLAELARKYGEKNLVLILPDASGTIEAQNEKALGRPIVHIPTPLVKLVLKQGKTEIAPLGCNGIAWWFPIAMIPTGEFQFVVSDSEGEEVAFKFTLNSLIEKGLL